RVKPDRGWMNTAAIVLGHTTSAAVVVDATAVGSTVCFYGHLGPARVVLVRHMAPDQHATGQPGDIANQFRRVALVIENSLGQHEIKWLALVLADVSAEVAIKKPSLGQSKHFFDDQTAQPGLAKAFDSDDFARPLFAENSGVGSFQWPQFERALTQ